MTFIQRFIEICFFRRGPADLPANKPLTQLVVLSYLMVSVLINQIDMSLRISLWLGLSDLLVMLAFMYVLLRVNKMLPRFKQSVMALAGTGALIGIMALPCLWSYHLLAEPSITANFVLFPLMVVMLWSLMVTAHILRHTLETTAAKSVALTMLYVLLAVIINGLVMSGAA